MSKNQEIAQEIVETAHQLGWNVHVRGSILTITKRLEPSTQDAFVRADGEYYTILGLMPSTSPGSIWGTDGGGVGAVAAWRKGEFIMNKSGCSKRVLNALAKMPGVTS